jgi:hypothetical protein
MANGNSDEGEGQLSRFLILRTFRTIKPEKMATFMNAITWQAAWLRHHFQWDRVVVGYALTDVPERVLEVYGIPTEDLGRAQGELATLHEQPEYGALISCCQDPQPDDEALLPAMQYRTFLSTLMGPRIKEANLKTRRKTIQRQLQENKKVLEELGAARVDLVKARANFDKADFERAQNDLGRLQGNLGRLQGRLGTAQLAFTGLQPSLEALQLEPSAVQGAKPAVGTGGLVVQQPLVIRRLLEDSEKKLIASEKVVKEKEANLGRQLSEAMRELKPVQQQILDLLRNIRVPDYFLNVTIRLKTGEDEEEVLRAYTDQMKLLLEEFAWDFIAAGERLPSPKRATGEKRGPEIMHLWRFGDANDLYRQMVGLRESRLYSAITQLLGEPERQMLMCDWEALSRTKRLPTQVAIESREE